MSNTNLGSNDSGTPEEDEIREAFGEVFKDVLHPVSHETKLEQIAEDLANGKMPTASPRELLRWFGVYRRGVNVVARIRKELKEKNILTFPDFEYEYLDGLVTFVLEPVVSGEGKEKGATNLDEASEQTAKATDNELVTSPSSIQITNDPTYRIGKLTAANQQLVSVTPDAEINRAVTLMMQNDFSQLPVMVGDRTVKGLFSWQSLGTNLHFNNPIAKVGDCMLPCQEISSEMSIFDAVSQIVRHDVVLVRNQKNLITGIVTTTDLSLQFRHLGEPFLLLGEIENHVRQLLDGCFSKHELETVRDPSDIKREINCVADLTFGEYLRLVENEERWNKLLLPLDRKAFIEKLDKVRVIRNDVMHFDPDGISEDDLDTLRKVVSFLQALANVKTKPNG